MHLLSIMILITRAMIYLYRDTSSSYGGLLTDSMIPDRNCVTFALRSQLVRIVLLALAIVEPNKVMSSTNKGQPGRADYGPGDDPINGPSMNMSRSELSYYR
jgi:hypothetical protein